MKTLGTITSNFPITESEYAVLDDKFGKLCHFASWQLQKKNSRNNHTNDPDDDVQELRIALLRAGSYYKRQTYIEQCFSTLEEHVKDPFIKKITIQLQQLWTDRRRHGANRQKFGEFQEIILDRLVKKNVPKKYRPRRDQALVMDSKFSTYLKQIVWNAQKSLGKKITREKQIRSSMVSLSEYDYLAS